MPLKYTTITQVSGPLIVVEQVADVHFDERVEVETEGGTFAGDECLKPAKDQPWSSCLRAQQGLDVRFIQSRF